jgi:uncharacterized membrane protein
MAINLHEAVELLTANGYLVCIKGKYKVMSDKLTKALKSSPVTTLTPVVVPKLLPGVIPKGIDWVEAYKVFINEAKIPKRLENRRGETYDANKYSDDGMKAFRKAMESGIDYQMLVRSTILYYKGANNRLKQSIGRYMHDGTWRSDYDDLMQSVKDNKVEEHIKSELDNGQYSFTQLG